ncbi:MAG: choice-of-anchor D domain-containing protein [Verrucomicrobiaceae bacterium]|nr:choice-of-anchor D domain-containing protein [Verrucomicrobiaceae bacterium]
MKQHLQALLTRAGAIAMAGFLCIFAACGSSSDYSVEITTPNPASTVTPPLVINGRYRQGTYAASTVRVELLRYSDNLSWTGSAWGASTLLTATRHTDEKTWSYDGALPSGANLPDGWYLITARADYADNSTSRSANTVFSVGVAAPPVAPALYGWGHNTSGQLGAGVFNSANHPVPVFTRGVLDGKIIAAVAGGYTHTLALTTEGRVYAWGSNAQRQLGLDVAAQPTEMDFPAAVNNSGVMAGKKIVSIATGEIHSLAVDDAGLVFSWGDNNPVPQQVGGLLTGKKVIQVAAGSSCSFALTSDGELFAWGGNGEGILGDGTFVSRSTPVAVTGLAGVFVSSISVRGGHILAVTSTGQVYAWGDNQYFQLGNNNADIHGEGIDSNVPLLVGGVLTGKVVTAVSAGRLHSFALADGKVYAWGGGISGQLGTGISGTGYHVTLPVELAGNLTGKTVTRICAADDFSVASTRENEVFVWGSNHVNQLAGASMGVIETLPLPADFSAALSGGRTIMALAAGDHHGMVLTGFPIVPAPEIVVEAQGVELQDGGAINCGTFGVGTSNPIWVTIRNSGGSNLADLKGLSVSLSDTNFHASFSQPTLGPNGETGFYVYFAPNVVSQPGPPLTATLQIFSNDADENPFDITLTGTSTPMGLADAGFNPGNNGIVQSLSIQPEGEILPGGSAFLVNGAGGQVVRYVARLDATTGTADSFNPVLDAFGAINALCSAVLPDGKILVGGQFSTVNGESRNRLVRLMPNGVVDLDFNAQITTSSGGVFAMALQGDGKIIISGSWSTVGGVSGRSLARLHPNGDLDTDWVPAGFGGRGVAVQADGMIVAAGSNGAGGITVSRMSGVDGSLDPGFTRPTITGSSLVPECVAVQPDGKILVGGNFTGVTTANDGPQPRNSICRLNANGTLDMGFNPNVTDGGTPRVSCIVLQANGRILISGGFATVGGQARNRIAMLNPGGSLEPFFNPGSTGSVRGVALQADGKVIASTGPSGNLLQRLSNDTATQTLTADSNIGRIEWLRGGASPETNLVTFDVSSDGGTTWTPLGAGTRMSPSTPGWQLTGATLPAAGQIRARAYPQGGYYSGSVSCLQTIAAYGTPPEITVTEALVPVLTGALRDFGVVGTGSASVVIQFTIQNTGGTALTGLSGTKLVDNDLFDGVDHTSQFDPVRPATFTLAPSASTTMNVIFRPKTTGRHTAILRIPSNDTDENPFNIVVTGLGSEPFTTYKQGETGDSATADTAPSRFSSGQSLLSAYATGTTDTTTDGDGTSITPPAGSAPFAPSLTDETNSAPPTGETFLFNYRRNKLSLADVIFQVEWSDTLAENDWHTTGVTEVIISDDDSIQQITATVPAGTTGRRFVRLKMTRP